MTSSANETSNAILLDRIEKVRSKRGYLLPHHGLLALTAPALLDGYDACYSALTLGQRDLCEFDKEFIWLGILAVKEEHLATQHVDKFRTAGGTDSHIIAALRIAALCRGVNSFEFGGTHWKSRVSELDAKTLYLSAISDAVRFAEVEEALLQLACAAIQTSRRGWSALEWHIEESYRLNVPETYLAEALTYAMFTGSIPNFIEGCEVWRAMIQSRRVPASTPFQQWADLDQGGP